MRGGRSDIAVRVKLVKILADGSVMLNVAELYRAGWEEGEGTGEEVGRTAGSVRKVMLVRIEMRVTRMRDDGMSNKRSLL